MKAVILAAGIASRLRPFTENAPKALVELGNGEKILDRILESLIENKIYDIVITTGHQSKKLEEYVTKNSLYKKLKVTFVHNPEYATTNYIYSLWVGKEKILGEDILLIHGDMVYDFDIISRLANQKKSSGMVNKEIPVPQKDFKARLEKDRIVEIGVNIFGENVYAFMPLYFLKKGDLVKWFRKIEEFIKKGDVKVYAENAFNEISNELKLYPLHYTNELCMEIDNPQDLQKVKKLLVNRKKHTA